MAAAAYTLVALVVGTLTLALLAPYSLLMAIVLAPFSASLFASIAAVLLLVLQESPAERYREIPDGVVWA